MLDNKRTIALTLAAICVARLALQLALYRSGLVAFTADEYTRVIWAYLWGQDPAPVWGGIWPPFHTYLLAAALWLNADLVATPRAFTILFGFASILLMYALGRRLLGGPRYGLLCALLLALNPSHVWLSSVPLSELPYFTILLGAILCLVDHGQTGRVRSLLAGCALVTCAGGFRFEGWFAAVACSLGLLGSLLAELRGRRTPARLAGLVGAGAIVWAVPAGWLLGNWLTQGNPFFSFASTFSDKASYPQLRDIGEYLRVGFALDPLVMGATLAGLPLLPWLWRRLGRWYLTLALAPPLIYAAIFRGQAEPPANFIRYLAPYLFVLTPFGLATLLFLLQRLAWLPRRSLAGALAVALFALFGARQVGHVFTYKNDPVETGAAVGQTIAGLLHAAPPAEAVMVESVDWYTSAARVWAQAPDQVFEDRVRTGRDLKASVFFFDPEGARACLAERNVGFVAARDPALKQLLAEQLALPSVASTRDFTFYRVDSAARARLAAARPCPL